MRLVEQLLKSLSQGKRRLFHLLDEEKVPIYQVTSYAVVSLAGLYLLVSFNSTTSRLQEILYPVVYIGWLITNIVAPIFTFVGRYLFTRAANVSSGRPNSAYGAAYLQLLGDMGVLSAMLLYSVYMVENFYYGEFLYTPFFLITGILGGVLFSLRSWRRIHQIRLASRRLGWTNK